MLVTWLRLAVWRSQKRLMQSFLGVLHWQVPPRGVACPFAARAYCWLREEGGGTLRWRFLSPLWRCRRSQLSPGVLQLPGSKPCVWSWGFSGLPLSSWAGDGTGLGWCFLWMAPMMGPRGGWGVSRSSWGCGPTPNLSYMICPVLVQCVPTPLANTSPQPTTPPSPRQGQRAGSWSPPQSACQKCGKPIIEHILDAAVLTAVKAFVDHRRTGNVLRLWWAEAHRWALDRPKVSPDDEALLHNTLHHPATHGPPDQASSPKLGDGGAVTIELAGRVWARRGRCRSEIISGPSGLIPISSRRARQPQQHRKYRPLRWQFWCASYMLTAS